MESNDTDVNDTEPEPIILPIPISLSQLMGSLMVTQAHTVYDEPVNDEPVNIEPPVNGEPHANDENVLPYENIHQPNLFMNIFTGIQMPTIHNPGQAQTYEENIQNQTFNQQHKYKKVCSKDFINSLSVQKVTKEMVEKKITCGICLDELKEGEEILELPCKDTHYFHIKNTVCDGIYPWLKENNTCPLCRHEFPSEEKEREVTEVEPNVIESVRPMLTPINLMNIVNQAIQDEEERMLQQTILASINDS
jgi:hypothetical protein